MGSEKKRKRRESEVAEGTPDRPDKAERKRLKRALKEKRAAESEASAKKGKDKENDKPTREVVDVPALVSPIATRKHPHCPVSGREHSVCVELTTSYHFVSK